MFVGLNSVWQFSEVEGVNDGLYRVLELCLNSSLAVLFSLEDPKKLHRPFTLKLDELDVCIDQGNAVPATFETPHYMFVAESKIPLNHKRTRDHRYKVVRKFTEQQSLLLDIATSRRNKRFSAFVKAAGETACTISRNLNLYWRFGQTKNALLPSFAKCGGAGKIREPGNAKRGAPVKKLLDSTELPASKNICAIDRAKMTKGLKKYYLIKNPLSMSEVKEKTIKDFYKSEVEISEITGQRALVPTLDQFYYWSSILIDPLHKLHRQSSKIDFENNKRGLTGFAAQNDPVPGSCFEIDATIANTHLVSRLNARQPIGRPIVYSITDRASRMIVGFYISLEFASWKAARQALINALTPKSRVLARYGLQISDHEYPCSHAPQSIMCDRGEMIFQKPEDALVPLMTMKFAPPYRADMKSIVERRFGILDKKLFNQLDGSTMGKPRKRGETDPAFTASLTLDRVARMLADDVMAHNRSQFDELAKCRLIIEHDLEPTPVNFWNIHLRTHRHNLSVLDDETIAANLAEKVTASVTKYGIKHDDLYYLCESAKQQSWLTLARNNGQWKIEARADQDDSSIFFVRPEGSSVFEKCWLLPRSEAMAGLHAADIAFWQDWKKKKKLLDGVTMKDIEAHERRTTMEKEAKERQKQTPNVKSKAAKKRDKKMYREAEKVIDNVVNLNTGTNPLKTAEIQKRSRRPNLAALIDDVLNEEEL